MVDRSLTTTDVVSELAQRGITASRDRVARMADTLFIRKQQERGKHRRYTAAQLELVHTAFVLHDQCNLSLTDIEALAHARSDTAHVRIEDKINELRTIGMRFNQIKEKLSA